MPSPNLKVAVGVTEGITAVQQTLEALSSKWGLLSALNTQRGSVAIIGVAVLWLFGYTSAESSSTYSMALFGMGTIVMVAYLVGQSFSDAVKAAAALHAGCKHVGDDGTEVNVIDRSVQVVPITKPPFVSSTSLPPGVTDPA